MPIVGHINFMNEFFVYWLIWTYDRIKYWGYMQLHRTTVNFP